MRLIKYPLFFFVLLGFCELPHAQDQHALVKLQGTKFYLTNDSFRSKVPIEVWNNKIFLKATVNEKEYRFILDTGSPTLLTKKVADELGLAIKAKNTGKDANGNLVTMNMSILDKLDIGEVNFRNIPIYIFDASTVELGDALFDGGVIGSEVMSLANWQINFKDNEIVITNDTKSLDYIKGAKSAQLKLGGYPYTPVIKFSVNNSFEDHAIFDTGSTELLHLYDRAFDEIKKRRLINSDIKKAHGTFGDSAGGRGQDATFYNMRLKSLSIGELEIKGANVWTRHVVPSLIGARLFDSHIVTLDYTNKTFYFYQYADQKTVSERFGFKPYFKNKAVYVGFLIEGSEADKAGLKLHDQILSIDDVDLRSMSESGQLSFLSSFGSGSAKSKSVVVFKNGDKTQSITLQY